MAYINPKLVKSPRDSWTLIDVLEDHGEEKHALAIGEWHGGGPEEGRRVLAMRWNGKGERPVGHPQSRGIPTWFVIPDAYNEKLVETLPEDKQIIAKALLGF